MLKMRLLIFVLVSCFGQFLTAADWPSFRGPFGNGFSPEIDIPVEWDSQTNIKWKVALPEPGNSSPIVSAGRIFVTCAENEGRARSLFCFDAKDGSQRWVRTVDFQQVIPTHETNNYCGSTPVTDGKSVVVWHGSAGLYCYGVDGQARWNRNFGEFRHMWGYGASPVLHQGRIILHAGPGKRVFLMALDLETGETIWSTEEPIDGDGERNAANQYMGSWSTPVVVQDGSRTLVVCSMATRVNGYDLNSGEIVWSCDGLRGENGDLAYTSPIIAGNICVAMGGYRGPAIGFQITDEETSKQKKLLWHVEPNPQRIGSGIFVDGYIYLANAGPSVIQCLDPQTGKIVWEERSGGVDHWGSLVTAGGRIYGTDQDGTTHVFLPNPKKFESVAKNQLQEPSNSTPAFSRGHIYIRTFQHLYCIREEN